MNPFHVEWMGMVYLSQTWMKGDFAGSPNNYSTRKNNGFTRKCSLQLTQLTLGVSLIFSTVSQIFHIFFSTVLANKMARDPPNVALSAAGASPSDIAKIRPPGRAGSTDKEKAP